jgi:hypothetical protein
MPPTVAFANGMSGKWISYREVVPRPLGESAAGRHSRPSSVPASTEAPGVPTPAGMRSRGTASAAPSSRSRSRELSELFALEQGDVDRATAVVQVRRAYANGRVKQTKTRLSRRAVPLQAIALEALDQMRPRGDSPLLFPNSRGGYLDFRNLNRRHWKPVQKRVGIEPLRDLYDLRHTYATFALRAGVPVFALSRFMGTSIAMIDLHYGHLAVDSYQHAVSLLDALALERAVDVGWTSARMPAKPRGDSVSRPRGRRSRRVVDARWTSRSEAMTTSRLRKG